MKKLITILIALLLTTALMGCNPNTQSSPAPTETPMISEAPTDMMTISPDVQATPTPIPSVTPASVSPVKPATPTPIGHRITPTPVKKPTPTPVNYSVVDSRGRSVNFKKIPQKVISLLPSDTEIIYALGDGAKLTAVSTYCNYPADTKNKKKMDSGSKMNIETIIGMTPDVVFLGQMAQTEAQFKQLEDAGIKVVVTEAGNISDTYKVMSIIGKTLQKEAKANSIINSMKSEFAAIAKKAAGNARVRIYVEVSPLQYGLWTCGSGTFQDELIKMIGAENIFSELKSWSAVSEEAVLSKNPQFIFTTLTAMEGMPDPIVEIKGRANWGIVDAVKNNKVFTADSDAFTRPGPRLVEAAKYLMNKVYGK